MSNIYPLKGKLQNYKWGGHAFIPELLGLEPGKQPCAEYWMGAHQNAPSVLNTEQGEIALNHFIEENRERILGKIVSDQFGRLPFLFKVLDVRDMLSIQVHPTKKEAEQGFSRENEWGVPMDAEHRNYKDNNHKPEIMVALSDFWLLHGFQAEDKIKAVLAKTPELTHLLGLFESEGYYGLYKSVMQQSDEDRDKVLRPLVERIVPRFESGQLDKSEPDYWAAKAAISFKSDIPDRGIYSIYFFNIVFLEAGQAIFQDAGIPHAYLEGQNMELMANSDNVLRGGLTPKYVDVPELLKHVEFKETHPKIMTGNLQPDRLERIFVSPAPDFQLSKIDIVSNDEYKCNAETAEILMVFSGMVEVHGANQSINLTKGEAVFITAGCNYCINSNGSATIFKATTPTALR